MTARSASTVKAINMSPHAPEFKIKRKMSEMKCTEFKKLVSEDGNTTCEMNIFEPKTFCELDNEPKYTEWLQEQTKSVSPEDGCMPLWKMTASTKAAAGYREVQLDALYTRATDLMADDKWSDDPSDKFEIMKQPDGSKCSYLARLNLIELNVIWKQCGRCQPAEVSLCESAVCDGASPRMCCTRGRVLLFRYRQ